MKRKYFDIIIIVGICLLFTYRFVFYKESATPQDNVFETTDRITEEHTVQTEEVFLSQEEETNELSFNLNIIESEDIWDKIMKDYISSISSMIDVTRMEGACVKSYKEEVRQDDWIYQVQEAYITKQRNETWDFVPDYPEYVYDENENLTNDYSYVVVKIKVKKVVKERIGELYLNSMHLCIYDEEGERVNSSGINIAALNKPHIGSYFECPLEIGEEIETEIACVIQDCYLSDENYYILNINNTGVVPFETKDFSFISLPLGQGIETDKLSSKPDTIKSEDIWDKIMKDYISSISSMIDVTRMEGACVKSYKEEVRQDDWIYQVQEAYITKQRNETWDFVPDYPEYIYDENENLINDYSYVVVKIKVKKVVKERIGELYLNSMGIHIYDERGERVSSGEVNIAALNKPHIGSYFECPLEIGEEIETEIACVIQDCYLSDENYYILSINNTGVVPFETKDFSFISLPLGQGG